MLQPIDINNDLLAQATQLSETGEPSDVIETALREYIERRQRLKITELFGTIDYDETFDYKTQRQRP
jgi:metal-responsive CopG/Arc/MetJ family transcriptional regulator